MLSAIYKNIKKQRAQWLSWEKERDAKFTCPESVEILTDIKLGEGQFDLVDIYKPRETSGKLPVIVNIHGGGMVMGTKHQNLAQCAYFAKKGFLVLGIEYPLVPEASFFEQLETIARTLDKAKGIIAMYDGDYSSIALTGDSAGAFLALYTAVIQNCAKAAKAAGVVPTDMPIKRLGLFSGLFYSTRVEKNGIFLLRKDFFGKKWKKHAFKEYLNPEHAEVVGALPPCILTTSKGDFLKKQTLRFAKKIENNGAEHKLVYIGKSVEHAFNALYPELEASIEANEAAAKFLR